MPKLLQINVTSNWGSTGRIAEQCNEYASLTSWECYTAYGRYANPSKFPTIHVGSKNDVYEHYFENRVLDNEGLASKKATKQLVEQIRHIAPDVVHLHNVHDHWLNYQILFEYLNQTNIKVVWTFHDFWAITGHCHHFVQANCNRFMSECYDCPYTKGRVIPLRKHTKRNFLLKKRLFSANRNMTIVPVSDWVEDIVRKSFLNAKNIRMISNGVDTEIFKPTSFNDINPLIYSYFLEFTNGKFVIMAVSSQWKSGAKGLSDYKVMAKMLKDDEVIVLVGVNDKIIHGLPSNMFGIRRTNNQQELAALYTRADVVTSFSSAETFGLTIVEGYACGTPAVVYDNTAPPALITHETGYVVRDKDYKSAYSAILQIKQNTKAHYSESCIKLVKSKYDKDICFKEYMKLYEEILHDNK